jgi:hypothetical protein
MARALKSLFRLARRKLRSVAPQQIPALWVYVGRQARYAAMLTIEEAERDVLAKWLVWSADRPRLTGHDVLIFYAWLLSNDPSALDFSIVQALVGRGDPRVRNLSPVEKAALLLVEKHGDEAMAYAEEQLDALLEEGDLDGAAAWWQTTEAIRLMPKKKPATALH